MMDISPPIPLNNGEDSGYDNDDSSDNSSCNRLDISHEMCQFSTSSQRQMIENCECLIRTYELSGHDIVTFSHVTFLYLGNCVQKLNLSNNKLNTLPDSVSQLKNLKVLDISQNEFSSLPMSLSKLHNLKVLNVSSNDFREIPTCLEYGMESVTHLDISHNKIENSVKPPMCLPSLQGLNLSNNNFSTVPIWLFHDHCRSLVNLDMSFNFCMDDTSFWIDLVHYTHLRVSAFKTLRTLNLSNIGGKLDSIRTALMYFQELRCLYFGSVSDDTNTFNHLYDIPVNVFYNCQGIVELHLPNTGLTRIPEDFCRLKNLKILDLSHNSLDWLPDSFGELIFLEELYLSHCDLVHLPKNFHQLSKLLKLALNNNKLSSLHKDNDYELRGLSELRWLDLYSNLLDEFPVSEDHLAILSQLDLENNYFNVEDCLEESWLQVYRAMQASLRNGNPLYRNRMDGPKIHSTVSNADSYDSLHRKYDKDSDEDSEEDFEVSYPEDPSCNSDVEEKDWNRGTTTVEEEDWNHGATDVEEEDWGAGISDDSNPDSNFDPNTIEWYYLPAGKYRFGWTPPPRPHKFVVPPTLTDFAFIPSQIHPKPTRRKRLNIADLKTEEGQFDDATAGDSVAVQGGEILWDRIKALQMFIRNPQGPRGYNCRICTPNEDCWHLGIWLPF